MSNMQNLSRRDPRVDDASSTKFQEVDRRFFAKQPKYLLSRYRRALPGEFKWRSIWRRAGWIRGVMAVNRRDGIVRVPFAIKKGDETLEGWWQLFDLAHGILESPLSSKAIQAQVWS